MGTVFSSNKSFVALQLERPYYYPGEVLNGVLCLNVLEPLDAKQLHVTVYGLEKTNWQETRTYTSSDGNGNTQTHSHTETYEQKVILLDVRFPLGLPAGEPSAVAKRSSSQVVPCGQYQWPFAFQLPYQLPPSWCCARTLDYGNEHKLPVFDSLAVLAPANKQGGEYGEVRYEVRAQCERPGMLTCDLRHAVPFGIMAHPNAVPPPKPVIANIQQEAKVCCCFGSGFVQVSASLSKDVLVPGEVAYLALEVDNGSKTNISAIEVHLKMNVTLSAHGRRNHYSRKWKLATSAGVQAGGSCQGSEARQLHLKVPPAMPASHRGSISEAHYVIEVRLKTHKLAKDMTLELPVVLCRTISSGAVGYPVPPDFWKPQVMPQFAWGAPGVPLPSNGGASFLAAPAAGGAGPSSSQSQVASFLQSGASSSGPTYGIPQPQKK